MVDRIATASSDRIVLQDYPILYVDDELPNLDVFEATFGDTFVVHVASSGREALEILDVERVAVVVADNRMPSMTGIELFTAIGERFPTVRRVLCTAYSDQRTAIEAINRAGVQHYLVKPWDVDEVEDLLRGLVASAHLEQSAHVLRQGLIDRERRGAIEQLRQRLTLDLSNVVTVLRAAESDFDESLREAAGTVPAALHTDLVEHAATVSEVVRTLSRIHRSARATHTVADEPTATEIAAQDVVDGVARMVSNELIGAARLDYNAPPRVFLWADPVGVIRILVAAVAWAAGRVKSQGVRPAVVHLRGRPEGDAVAFEVAFALPGAGELLRGWMDRGLEGASSVRNPHLLTLVVAPELAAKMSCDLSVRVDGDSTVISLRVPIAS